MSVPVPEFPLLISVFLPIEGFAVAFSVFALVNLAALWYARKHFRVAAALWRRGICRPLRAPSAPVC